LEHAGFAGSIAFLQPIRSQGTSCRRILVGMSSVSTTGDARTGSLAARTDPIELYYAISIGAAVTLLMWLPSVVGNPAYGYFGDEFYYLACSERLAAGYVDHPPLSILLLGVWRAVAGDSLMALRLLPAACAGLTAMLTWRLARQLGGGTASRALAGLALVTTPMMQVLSSFYSMNAIEVLVWTACCSLFIEIARGARLSHWIALGILAGLGFEAKHTIVLLGLAWTVAILLTPERRELARRGPWIAAAVLVAIALPNLAWQAYNDWPSLEFYRNATLRKNVPTPPLGVLAAQLVLMNPLTIPLWVVGLATLVFAPQFRRERSVGLACSILLVLLVVSGTSRPDRIAGMYPVLFAAGAVAWDRWLRARPLGLRYTISVGYTLPLGVTGCGFALLTLPVLAPSATASLSARLDLVPDIERGQELQSKVPFWLAGRLGWEDMVREVERVSGQLSPEERRTTVVLAPHYGAAGAVEVLASDSRVPRVISGHNSYFSWGTGDAPVETVIAIGIPEASLGMWFASVELVGRRVCEYCIGKARDIPILLARDPVTPFSTAWQQLKHYD